MIKDKWNKILEKDFTSEYYKKIKEFILKEYQTKTIYPEYDDIFNCLKYTDYDEVKVVILGQDPYHEPNQAHGLAFSVNQNEPAPPSLRNIFKELFDDTGTKRVNNDLTDWAKQGVLLLNSILTVEKGNALAHKNIGWEIFTDNIISYLNEREDPVIFVLWGSYARSKKALITNSQHYIIESNHPSPLSAYRGFFGSKPFTKINKILIKLGKEPINW